MLRSYSRYHPELDSFNASLFLEGTEPDIKPFAFVQVPKTKALPESPITIDQVVPIADLTQFTNYAKLVLASETYRLAIRGRPTLREGSYPAIKVDYNEVVTLKGLNSLKGLDVVRFQILLSPESDGTNLIGTVKIPNPSVMTLEMGNVTLGLSVGGDPIGQGLIQNLVLNPGDNELPIRATTDRLVVLSKLGEYADGVLPVDVRGNTSVFNGQSLTYYEEALRSSTQQIKLRLAEALENGGKYPPE